MTHAEKETIEAFCRELALALRRITGCIIEYPPAALPTEIQDPESVTLQADKKSDEQPEDE